ncbi:hypothetical protein J5N97_019557 [Dioscorea zingiberensis]|uniref:Protein DETOXIFICATION n=1 Tax=Dioscorea zingiberensis TaxID=325984 RepID=A0A9D5HCZ8_9LILI|nr:hypothetical protein J5N97_019557 [Dioscorea zingiberensis]
MEGRGGCWVLHGFEMVVVVVVEALVAGVDEKGVEEGDRLRAEAAHSRRREEEGEKRARRSAPSPRIEAESRVGKGRCERAATMADVLEEDAQSIGRDHIIKEVKKQLSLSGPLIVASLLDKLILVISLSFVGHLGELPLSGASMATSFAAVTGLSVLSGMGTALDTLCGQAFGAEKYHLLGIYLQRAMIITTVVSIPLAFIWAFTGEILKVIGQDKEISIAAEPYARCMIPILFAYGLLQSHYRFLQAQNIAFPMMLTSGFTVLAHIFTCWILMVKCKIGYIGAAIANTISYCISLTLIAVYVRLSPRCKDTWTGFSREALHDLSSFVKLAIPSALMICLEFWSFEVLVLLAGFLPNPKLETSILAICLNTITLAYMIPFGIGASVSTRVSNELGAGHPRNACLAICIAEIIAITEGTIVGSTLILGHHIWSKVYSNDTEVVKYVARMMPLLALSHFIDATQCVLIGTVQGCGRQKLGVAVNLGAFYMVGLPCSVVLAFLLHLKGKGLWLGVICGISVQVLFLLIMALSTNWGKEAKKARNRVNNSIIPVETVTAENDSISSTEELRLHDHS